MLRLKQMMQVMRFLHRRGRGTASPKDEAVEGVLRFSDAGVAENPLRHGASKSAAPPPPTVEELELCETQNVCIPKPMKGREKENLHPASR